MTATRRTCCELAEPLAGADVFFAGWGPLPLAGDFFAGVVSAMAVSSIFVAVRV
jgi:hypothetical protein